MTNNLMTLAAEGTIKEAAKMFARYSFCAVLTVDEWNA
jgi:hypothetical protein